MDSDPDIEFIEKDSGMSSLGGSKDETPERKTAAPAEEVPAEKPTEEPEKPTTSTTVAETAKAEAAAPAPVTTISTKNPDSENYDDEPDETLGERLLGLTEMFPDCVRNLTGQLVNYTSSSVKTLYSFTCNASWIFFTSSVILFAPVIFETERAQMEEMQKTQQKQVLLGPGSAMAAAGPATATPSMPLMR